MTLDQAIALDDTAEVNWGELAADLLSPERQAYYEGLRIPAWLRYQRHVAVSKMRHWTDNEKVMPFIWQEYRASVAKAFKTAAAKEIVARNIAAIEREYAVRNPNYISS